MVISSPTGSRIDLTSIAKLQHHAGRLESGMNSAASRVTNGCEEILPGSWRFHSRAPASENL